MNKHAITLLWLIAIAGLFSLLTNQFYFLQYGHSKAGFLLVQLLNSWDINPFSNIFIVDPGFIPTVDSAIINPFTNHLYFSPANIITLGVFVAGLVIYKKSNYTKSWLIPWLLVLLLLSGVAKVLLTLVFILSAHNKAMLPEQWIFWMVIIAKTGWMAIYFRLLKKLRNGQSPARLKVEANREETILPNNQKTSSIVSRRIYWWILPIIIPAALLATVRINTLRPLLGVKNKAYYLFMDTTTKKPPHFFDEALIPGGHPAFQLAQAIAQHNLFKLDTDCLVFMQPAIRNLNNPNAGEWWKVIQINHYDSVYLQPTGISDIDSAILSTRLHKGQATHLPVFLITKTALEIAFVTLYSHWQYSSTSPQAVEVAGKKWIAMNIVNTSRPDIRPSGCISTTGNNIDIPFINKGNAYEIIEVVHHNCKINWDSHLPTQAPFSPEGQVSFRLKGRLTDLYDSHPILDIALKEIGGSGKIYMYTVDIYRECTYTIPH